MPSGPGTNARVAAALAELERVARELLATEQAVAPEAKVEAVELAVTLSFHGTDSRVASEFRLAEAEKLVALLRGRVREALLHAVAFERGHVYCLRCESSRCSHSTPPTPRSVFSAYDQTGRPEWVELDKLLHRRGDPRLERLYGGRELVAVAIHRDEIYGPLLPGFDEARWRCYVLGQLVVGNFAPQIDSRDARDSRETMALTVQLVRSEKAPDGPLLGLNLVGRLPSAIPSTTRSGAATEIGGAPNGATAAGLEESILEGLPDALRQLRREIGVFSGRGGTRVPGIGVALERIANRCHVLLREAARDLEHRTRMGGRRTGHAQQRSRERDRPTHKAFEDARAAGDDRLFFDGQHGTVCVVGPSNRVHFFTLEGKQVTSVVFPSHVVQQRVASKRWAPLEPEKVAAFRRAVDA
jgi:hypothetical protein